MSSISRSIGYGPARSEPALLVLDEVLILEIVTNYACHNPLVHFLYYRQKGHGPVVWRVRPRTQLVDWKHPSLIPHRWSGVFSETDQEDYGEKGNSHVGTPVQQVQGEFIRAGRFLGIQRCMHDLVTPSQVPRCNTEYLASAQTRQR